MFPDGLPRPLPFWFLLLFAFGTLLCFFLVLFVVFIIGFIKIRGVGYTRPRQSSRLTHAVLAEVQVKSLPTYGDTHSAFADVHFYTGEEGKCPAKANRHSSLLSNDHLFRLTASPFPRYWSA